MIRLEVRRGSSTERTIASDADEITIGRGDVNDLVLIDAQVSGEHARLVLEGDSYVVMDVGSTHGTRVVRDGATLGLEGKPPKLKLQAGDEIELGPAGTGALLAVVAIEVKPDLSRVLSVRSMREFEAPRVVERDAERMRGLYEAQKRLGAVTDLSEVLETICAASFDLVPTSTHVTIAMRDDESATKAAGSVSNYVPVLTRVRGAVAREAKPVPVARSVFRKVVTERAALIAADAQTDVGTSESLMGASIRSTLAVPLWKGEDILGVIQLDHRENTNMFTPQDLEVMGVLAHGASLAVANARLMKRLAAAEERLRKENSYLKGKELERRSGGKSGMSAPVIVGDSPAMNTLITQLDKVVDTRVTVLIEGETGVGKELVAASVHYRSRRRDKLFVGQNCAAMPENLLESELFGHKKGSFTGATEEKKGLFEIADGGTLFLDEVTEMPISLQSKLLRVLQEGEIRPVGATQEKRVDVRIVAATNRNLEKEVAEGRFREDLYYRLKVFPLRVPPLRERREDIPLIAEHFLAKYVRELGKPCAGYTQQTLELMQTYDWPGNVRELVNEVQRLVIQIDPGGFVTPDLLSPQVRRVEGVVERIKPTKGTLKAMMDEVERWLLIESLREHDGNKTQTAKSLGITREGLHKKLRQFGL